MGDSFMSTQDIFADLLMPGGNVRPRSPLIRPNSPVVRPLQTRVDSSFSPNSPFSPFSETRGKSEKRNPAVLPQRWTAALWDGRQIEVSAPSGLTRAEAIHDAGYHGRVVGIAPYGADVEPLIAGNPPEPSAEPLTLPTPSGGTVAVQARDKAHGEQLRRRNPAADPLCQQKPAPSPITGYPASIEALAEEIAEECGCTTP